MDRLITIKVDYFDRETEVAITRSKSGIPHDEAQVIVDIVRELRDLGLAKQGPSLRACIMIARVVVQQGAHARAGDATFLDVARDVLGSLTAKVVKDGHRGAHATVDDMVAKHTREHRRHGKHDRAVVPMRATAEEGA